MTPTTQTRRPSLLPSMHPPQHGRKHQGKRRGINHRLRSWPHGSTLSSILPANVRALDNELDDLRARISFQRDIRNCNILLFNRNLAKSWNTGQRPGQHHSPRGRTLCSWQWTSTCRAQWTGWWCSPASASSSCLCWCWRSTTATSSSSPSCSSSGLASRPRTLPTSWTSTGAGAAWPGRLCRAPSMRASPQPSWAATDVRSLLAVVEKKILNTPGQHWEPQEELLPSSH